MGIIGRRMLTIGTAVLLLCGLAACGGGGGSTPTSTTSISGKLLSGTVSPVAAMTVKDLKVAAAGDPLVGYQLYCITFATPPLAASGISGSDGSVTLSFDTSSATFGCFILDADGNGVATLIFVNGAATGFGQTVTATGTVDLGTITVELRTGAAQATTPSGVTIDTTTPTAATCPLGSWYATDVGQSPTCPPEQKTESSVWIVKKPDGTYAASFTTYNVGIYEQCSIGSRSDIPMTFGDNQAIFSFPFDFENPPYCDPLPLRIATVVVNVNSDCTTGTISGTVTNCGSCTPAPCSECGSLTCDLTGNVVKQ